eukprot:CAMPEP_0174322556 /NCGR_PEP_ID=MMETSP0810-20121108/11070_1 /TAXON_ID=73025 ORGANISM="Eutreptiella gymnastica-like, Strain CCMP1594" /NCGR_SAMPLE_ID=MMETSP0810 /ASSEMBLY_ACC=CAM_ASM_000659 /LENGTH=38 /DNA_ID= /DNA_START= /DNA_END= /DNA_ORIENTATION=
MTALEQHSMVPPFYANRAKVAPRARHPQYLSGRTQRLL